MTIYISFNSISVKNLFFLLILGFSISTSLSAQKGWEAGGWLGASHYFGDLNTDNEINSAGFAGGAFGRYNFNNRLALKMGGTLANISGSDTNSENTFELQRNLSFESIIVDAAAQFEFNFLPYDHGSKKNFFTPYLFAGINAFYYNPTAILDGVEHELRPLGTEGQFIAEEYTTVDGGIVYGAGLKFSLNYLWSIEIELSSRRLFTDYLDDVSTTYPEVDDLENLRGDIAVLLSDRSGEILEDPIGVPGFQRGNSQNNDFYVTFGISLVYYFGDIACPAISY